MKTLTQRFNESLLNEAAKDDMRIRDINAKAAGNSSKAYKLASTMANAIKDVNKAKARYEASLKINGDHDKSLI